MCTHKLFLGVPNVLHTFGWCDGNKSKIIVAVKGFFRNNTYFAMQTSFRAQMLSKLSDFFTFIFQESDVCDLIQQKIYQEGLLKMP